MLIHPAKSSKSLTLKTKNTPQYNKFETLSNMSDKCTDMDNEPIRIQEPKLQLIFMKMTENFSEIISNMENLLNSTLNKKVNGDLI